MTTETLEFKPTESQLDPMNSSQDMFNQKLLPSLVSLNNETASQMTNEEQQMIMPNSPMREVSMAQVRNEIMVRAQEQQLVGEVKQELKSETQSENVEFRVTVEETGQKTKLTMTPNMYQELLDLVSYICLTLQVADPESLMMIRDKKPRYLVSELDEIENGESYVLIRKSGGPSRKRRMDRSIYEERQVLELMEQ